MSRLFLAGVYGNLNTATYYIDVQSRLAAVKRATNVAILREALTDDSLQKTVRVAIERRIKQLEGV